MEKEKFVDLLSNVCMNKLQGNATYAAPFLNLTKQDPVFTEPEFREFAEDIYTQVTAQSLGMPDTYVISETLRQICFDGMGFFVPCFGCYINAKAENQLPNDVQVIKEVSVPFYNFEKDRFFNGFLLELVMNLNDLPGWIKTKNDARKNQILEFTAEMNEDDKGINILSKPYIRKYERK